jgi:hypothetical protein
MVGSGLGLWRSMIICVLNMQFLCKKAFSGSAWNSRINKRLISQEAIFVKFFEI